MRILRTLRAFRRLRDVSRDVLYISSNSQRLSDNVTVREALRNITLRNVQTYPGQRVLIIIPSTSKKDYLVYASPRFVDRKMSMFLTVACELA